MFVFFIVTVTYKDNCIELTDKMQSFKMIKPVLYFFNISKRKLSISEEKKVQEPLSMKSSVSSQDITLVRKTLFMHNLFLCHVRRALNKFSRLVWRSKDRDLKLCTQSCNLFFSFWHPDNFLPENVCQKLSD